MKFMQTVISPPASEFTPWPILFNGQTAEIIERVRRSSPELFGLPEEDLRAVFEEKKIKVQATTSMLRIRFWDEYARAQGSQMIALNIYGGICHGTIWERSIRDPYKLAWIMCPVANFLTQCDHMIVTLMENLRGAILYPPVDPITKKLDLKTAKFQFEMLQYFDQRKYGAIVQRVESKQLNTNVNVTLPNDDEAINAMIKDMSVEQLQAKLEEMKQPLKSPLVIEAKK